LPSVRITSAPSFPMGAGNLRPSMFEPEPLPSPRRFTKGDEAQFITTPFEYGRENGGDYVAMAADAGGDFHPVWPDARTGTWQIYSARIHVSRVGESIARTLAPPNARERVRLKRKTSVHLESSSFDSTLGEITILARIVNTSTDTLYGPFTVEFPVLSESPVLLNPSNGMTGPGAAIAYVGAAGTLDILPPLSATEALPWRFRAKPPHSVGLSMETIVYGYVRRTFPNGSSP
jgi:hypothetical protein